MSRLHQAELIMLLFSFMIGFWQSQEMLYDQWDGISDEVPSKTHWGQLLPHTLRNIVYVHVVIAGLMGFTMGVARVWIWLGGL